MKDHRIESHKQSFAELVNDSRENTLLSLTEDLKGREHGVPEQPHKGRSKNSFHLPPAFGSLVKVFPQVLLDTFLLSYTFHPGLLDGDSITSGELLGK